MNVSFEGECSTFIRSVTRAVATMIVAFSIGACSEVSPPPTAETANEQAEVSSDANLAKALLFRWWGIFEAGDDVDVSNFFVELFTPDVYLTMPGVELSGDTAIQTAFANLPADNGRSHQLTSLAVKPLSERTFQLDAEFTYQIARPDGSIDAGYSNYRHEVVKQNDGTFRLAKLTAELGEPLAITEFEPSYIVNRARGTLVQYLGITDLLHSDYARLREVMGPESEIHGMFDPSVETHNERGDGVLKGLDEISAWLATRAEKFLWVSHTVVDFAIESTGHTTYKAAADIAIRAQPINGELIEVILPISFSMIDSNERFMLITAIRR